MALFQGVDVVDAWPCGVCALADEDLMRAIPSVYVGLPACIGCAFKHNRSERDAHKRARGV